MRSAAPAEVVDSAHTPPEADSVEVPRQQLQVPAEALQVAKDGVAGDGALRGNSCREARRPACAARQPTARAATFQKERREAAEEPVAQRCSILRISERMGQFETDRAPTCRRASRLHHGRRIREQRSKLIELPSTAGDHPLRRRGNQACEPSPDTPATWRHPQPAQASASVARTQ